MREIKFRAWDISTQTMYCSNEEHTVWCGGLGCSVNSDKCQIPGNYVPMQYTGLKDKNGKDIYEGDILKTDLDGYVSVVEWIYSQWQYVYKCTDETLRGISSGINNGLNDDGYEDGEKSHFEVIGNIYENPKLIK